LLAPVLIWGAVLALRKGRTSSRHLRAIAIVSVLAFPLLGGAHYMTRAMASKPPSAAKTPMQSIILTGYGEWSYLWQAPALIWMQPFSGDEMEVYVPWRGESWFWPRYDLHDAGFGWQISVLVVLLPWALYRFRDGGPEAVRERLTILAVGIGIALLVFPVRFRAYGFVSAFPRYLLYLPVLIASLSLSPIVRRLEAGKRHYRMLAMGIVLVLSALFARFAVTIAVRDRYTPVNDVLWAAARPGTRFIPAMTLRAGPMFDDIAPPTASVDVYGGFDTWIYPIMGQTYQRDIHFVDSYEDLRPDVEWIVVDRAYQVVWGKVDQTSTWRENMYAGQVSERDMDFMRRVGADPRYEAVLVKVDGAQAIFRRRDTAGERRAP
jgi:hypothetical protein